MSEQLTDNFSFIFGTEEPIHKLYHICLDSWNRIGKAIFAEAGVERPEAQSVAETLCSHVLASVILTHGGEVNPQQLAEFVFLSAEELMKEAKNAKARAN